MKSHRLAITIALTLALASPASGFDITGTWTGTRKCKLLIGGVKSKTTREGTVEITQDGGIGFLTTIGSTHLYTGTANPDAEKPDKGEIMLIHCGTNDVVGDPGTFDAIGRFTVRTKTGKVKASIAGMTFFSDPDPGVPTYGTCKWKLTRTDPANPGISTSCPTM